MKARLFVLLLAGFATASPAQNRPGAAPPDRYTLVHAGTLLAVPGQPPQEKMTVVVRNDRVLAVGSGFLTPEAAGVPAGASVQVVDLSNRFVLPGLMDAHVHLFHEPNFSRRRSTRGDRYPTVPNTPGTGAEGGVNAMVYARRTLAAGFTTVRDVGSDDQSVFAARDAINAGRMIGPRILVSGSIVSVTGGHGDSVPWAESGDPNARMHDATCDGPMECRKVVRFLWKIGADVIKFTSSSGIEADNGKGREIFPDEIEAIVSTAHLLGLKAATHAYSAETIKQAVRAGVDSIEHGFLVDDEGLAMMKKAGTWLVPTLSASYPPPIFHIPDPPTVKLRNEYRAFERAYATGVKIAFGTDAGTFAHGSNAKEFDLMVRFGMKPMDAIYCATVSTAALFGLAADIGTLEKGKVADIVAVEGNPLEQISVLHKIDFVMKDGRVAKHDGQMTEPFTYPEQDFSL